MDFLKRWRNKMKTKKINQVGLFIQAILLMTSLYALVLTIFMEEFSSFLYISLGLTWFSMGYNHYKSTKKVGLTALYTIIGIACFIAVLFK